MAQIVFEVDGIKCNGCVSKIENSLNQNENIEKVNVELDTKKVTISGNDTLSMMELKKDLEELGYQVIKMQRS